jgi:hypothetical protein
MRRTHAIVLLLPIFLLGLSAPSHAQQFTFDSPVLAEETTLSFSLAESNEKVEVDGLPDSSRTSRRREGAGTLVVDDFVAGLRSRAFESELRTATLLLDTDVTSESAFLGWHFRDVLFSPEDILTVLIGGGSFKETNVRVDGESFIDAVERSEVSVPSQWAVVYRLPWLLLAYSRANVDFDYELTDNLTQATISDLIELEFEVMSFGLRFFDGVFRLDYERRDNDPARGEVLELESLAQTFQAATLDLGVVALSASETSNELELKNFFEMERTEEAVAVRFALRKNLFVTFKNTRTVQSEAVFYAATPVVFDSDGERNEVSFTLRFSL